MLGPDQRIDRMSALRAVTIDAAWQVLMDDDIGSVEPGKLADLVVLSGSPLTAPDLRELLVDTTLIGASRTLNELSISVFWNATSSAH